MISLAQKSRQCLIDDVKGLEAKLLQLQEQFDLIINWIRSEYCGKSTGSAYYFVFDVKVSSPFKDLSGLPDYVIIAVSGGQKWSESNVCKDEQIKVEYDNLDDSSHLSADGDVDPDNSSKKLLVKVDEDILKDIESGPVSR